MSNRTPPRRVGRIGLIALIGLVMVIHFASLTVYPPPTCDESTYASTAASLLERGRFGFGMWPAGEPIGRHDNAIMLGHSYIFSLAGVFAVLGTTLVSARLHAALGWIAASILIYLIGRDFYTRWVGRVAALLFASSQLAFMTGHTARPESWLAAGTLLAVWLLLHLATGERERGGLALGAGFAAFWLFDIHGNGVFFGAALGSAALVDLGIRQKRLKMLALFAAGVLLGMMAWLGIRVPFSSVEDFAAQVPYLGQLLNVPPPAVPPLASAQRVGYATLFLRHLQSLPEWFQLIFWQAGGPLALSVGGLAVIGTATAACSTSYRRVNCILLWVMLISLALFGLLTPLRWIQYGILWSGFWLLLGAAGLESIVERSTTHTDGLRRGAQLILYGMVLANLAGNLWLVYRFAGGEYDQTSRQIAATIPAGSRVVGDPVWWWELREDREFLTDEYFMRAERAQGAYDRAFFNIEPGDWPADVVDRVQSRIDADYLLVDRAFACVTDPSPVHEAMQRWAVDRCELIGEVPGGWAESDSGKGWHQLGQVTSIYACDLP